MRLYALVDQLEGLRPSLGHSLPALLEHRTRVSPVHKQHIDQRPSLRTLGSIIEVVMPLSV